MITVFKYNDYYFTTKTKKFNAKVAHAIKKAVDKVCGNQFSLTTKDVFHNSLHFKMIQENGKVIHFLDTIQMRNIPKDRVVKIKLLPQYPFMEIV